LRTSEDGWGIFCGTNTQKTPRVHKYGSGGEVHHPTILELGLRLGGWAGELRVRVRVGVKVGVIVKVMARVRVSKLGVVVNFSTSTHKYI